MELDGGGRHSFAYAKIFVYGTGSQRGSPVTVVEAVVRGKRLDAAELFWSDEHSTDQQVEAIASLAAHMKFRTKRSSRSRWSAKPSISFAAQRVATHCRPRARQLPPRPSAADDGGVSRRTGNLSRRRTIAEGKRRRTRRGEDGRSGDELASKYPADDVSLYFSTLVSQDPETWKPLVDLPQTTGGG